MANGAARRGHVLRHPLAVGVRIGLLKIAIEKFEDAGEAEAFFGLGLFRGDACGRSGSGRGVRLIERRIAVENADFAGRRKLFERRVEAEAVRIGGELQRALEHRGAGAGAEAAVEERARPVGDDSGGIEIVFRTETVAGRAGAVGRIEAEGARLELRNGDAAVRAGQLFGEDVVSAANDGDRDETARRV